MVDLAPTAPSSLQEQDLPSPPSVDTQPASETTTPQERLSVSKLAQEYATAKTDKVDSHRQIYDRAIRMALKGSNDLNKRIEKELPWFRAETVPATPEDLSKQLQVQVEIELQGQPEKLMRARDYIEKMSQRAAAHSLFRAQELFDLQSPKQIEQPLTLMQLEELQRQEHFTLVREAVAAISLQDICANRLAIGDHGWMHLTKDMEDAEAIAEGRLGRPLTTNELFLVGLLSAFHDIGYADPEVHDKQVEGPKHYGLDMGHPFSSFIYVKKHRKKFDRVLNASEYQAFSMGVLFHENPEKAHHAGAEYEDVAQAFSYADAAAAFGIFKLPPILAHFPEAVGYLSLLEKTGKTDLPTERAKLEALVRERAPVQAEDLLEALDHFSPDSLGRVIGRLSAEMAPITTSDGVTTLTVRAQVARDFENQGMFAGCVELAVQQTTKLFNELASLQLSKEHQSELWEILQGSGQELSPELAQKISKKVEGGVITLLASEKRIAVVFDPTAPVQEQAEYFGAVMRVLREQEISPATRQAIDDKILADRAAESAKIAT